VYNGTESEYGIFYQLQKSLTGQMSVHKVEIKEFSQAREATDVKIQHQLQVDLLFNREGYHPVRICTQRATVNKTFYFKVLERFIDPVKHKQEEL
jgi:hypothetical protein